MTVLQENVAEEERLQFKILMDRIGWFMFDFLVLGYIHDQETGASFSVPVSEKWTIYIEACFNRGSIIIMISIFNI